MAHLVMSGVSSPCLNLDSEGESWLRLSKAEASIACVELQAVAEVCVVHMIIGAGTGPAQGRAILS